MDNTQANISVITGMVDSARPIAITDSLTGETTSVMLALMPTSDTTFRVAMRVFTSDYRGIQNEVVCRATSLTSCTNDFKELVALVRQELHPVSQCNFGAGVTFEIIL